jgi:cation-transporting ATPase E
MSVFGQDRVDTCTDRDFRPGQGLGRHDGTPLRAVSGPELATLDRERFERAAIENTIFGTMSPRLDGQVVDALRARGEAVAVVGDGVKDLPAMQQANLAITRHSSSPAALSVADIILLEDSFQALLRVLDKGQRIANGLLDILKLYLNQIAYLTLLILVIWGAGLGFPYLSKQASLITIVSVILPSLALSLWAPAGVVPRTHLGRLLARFVAPAAVTVSVAAVVVYIIFLEMSGEVAYAQLAVTYTLVISGLVLVVLLRPPVRGLTLVGMGGDERSGDWRPTVMVMVLLILVFVVASIPLADGLFGLKPLQQPTDYLVVGLAVLAWALTASLIWRVSALWTRWRGVEDL